MVVVKCQILDLRLQSTIPIKDSDRIKTPVIVTHSNGDTNITETIINVEVPARPVLYRR